MTSRLHRERGALQAAYAGVFAALTGLLLVGVLGMTAMAPTTPLGAEVVLVRPCTAGEAAHRGDDNSLFLHLVSDGSVYLNSDRVDVQTLGSQLQWIYARRQIKVLWLVGDEDIPYGRVAETAAGLEGRIEGLVIFLPTSSNEREADRSKCLLPVGEPR